MDSAPYPLRSFLKHHWLKFLAGFTRSMEKIEQNGTFCNLCSKIVDFCIFQSLPPFILFQHNNKTNFSKLRLFQRKLLTFHKISYIFNQMAFSPCTWVYSCVHNRKNVLKNPIKHSSEKHCNRKGYNKIGQK